MSTRARATSMRAIRHGQQRTQLARILQWLYGAGEQGIAVPDLTPGNGFLFQDSAGTTPVTEFEQPVGRILDRSGRGNHLIQATSTKRPTLSARYNLLQRTEEFDNAAWAKFAANVTPNAGIAPNGTSTADYVVETSATSEHRVEQAFSSFVSGSTYKLSVRAKAGERTFVRVGFSNLGALPGRAVFNLSNGTIASTPNGTSSIQSVGNGYYECTVTAVCSSSVSANVEINVMLDATTSSYAGDTSKGLYLWGADLRRTIDTIGMPAYQRVGASNDYDTAGFYPYLAFDGTDDSMATAASVDFSGTDKMTVFAGVTKLSDGSTRMLAELSGNLLSNNGTFYVTAPDSTTDRYSFVSKGTVDQGPSVAGYAAPITNVLTGIGNISAPAATLRVNGAQAGNATGSQGTGNFGNYTLFLGARNNASLFFNGRMYPFFIRGAATDAGLIAQVEQYIKGRMPVNF